MEEFKMVEGLIEKYRLGDLITKPKQDEEMVKSLERMESSLDFEIERIAKEQVNFKKLHLKFPVIDPSFLRRKSQKPHIVNTSEDGNIFSLFLPRFAIYSLDSNKCGFSIDVECEKTGGRRAIPEKKELKISY
ncbi:hypothetical protein KY325_01510, partial [Candidatus Woesearchaeota archaeon]|nr:hypothetical protein [Candidatus Woesearchaeota archaeon]